MTSGGLLANRKGNCGLHKSSNKGNDNNTLQGFCWVKTIAEVPQLTSAKEGWTLVRKEYPTSWVPAVSESLSQGSTEWGLLYPSQQPGNLGSIIHMPKPGNQCWKESACPGLWNASPGLLVYRAQTLALKSSNNMDAGPSDSGFRGGALLIPGEGLGQEVYSHIAVFWETLAQEGWLGFGGVWV